MLQIHPFSYFCNNFPPFVYNQAFVFPPPVVPKRVLLTDVFSANKVEFTKEGPLPIPLMPNLIPLNLGKVPLLTIAD
jgi:hypothetical protein